MKKILSNNKFANMIMSCHCRFVVISVLLGACSPQQTPESLSVPVADHKTAAVSLSLQRFFAEDWGSDNSVIYIAPTPYARAIPNRIAGKPVEIASEEELLKRLSKSEVPPDLVRINVYDQALNDDADFSVGVSMYGASVTGFNVGYGCRYYEYSIDSGAPLLVRTGTEEF